MTIHDEVAGARSLLFVPASRPDRFERARDSGADLIILDLEDAVPADQKDSALQAVRQWVERDPARTVVRVNGAEAHHHATEVTALAGTGVALMLPKAESTGAVGAFASSMPGSPVIALVETPRGVLAAADIAELPEVSRLALGNVDLAASLGVAPASREALWRARSELVLASAAHGKAGPIDGVTTTLDDEPLLAEDVRHAIELGFTGKLCIHPRQVDIVNRGWLPTAAELAWARRVVALDGQGAVALDGEMVDEPVVLRARAILDRQDAASGR